MNEPSQNDGAVPLERAPIADPPALQAHQRVIEALLAAKAVIMTAPNAPSWRTIPVQLEHADRVWTSLPVNRPEQLQAFELDDALRALLTIVVAVPTLPSQGVLVELEGRLGVAVVACTPDGVRGGPRATDGGSLAILEAALAHTGPTPDVDEAWAAAKSFGEEALFLHHLQLQAPVPWLTRVFVVACVAIWILQLLSGISATSPSVPALRDWGSSAADLTLLQPWRLLSAGFLHAGIVHLGINMVALWFVGPFCERLFGRVGFALIYLTSIVAGFMASLVFSPYGGSAVGASGGILGLIGAILGLVLLRRDMIPKPVATRIATSIGKLIGLNAILWVALGIVFPIDHAGHAGGFLLGFLGGVALARPIPPPGQWERRRILGALALVLGLGLAWPALRGQPAVQKKGADLQQAFDLLELRPHLKTFDGLWSEVVAMDGTKDPDARRAKAVGLRPQAEAFRADLERFSPPPRIQPLVDSLKQTIVALERYLEHLAANDPQAARSGEALVATYEAFKAQFTAAFKAVEERAPK